MGGLDRRALSAIACRSYRNRKISTPHLDALRDLKHVNADLVAAALYPVLKRDGDLLPTRIREQGNA